MHVGLIVFDLTGKLALSRLKCLVLNCFDLQSESFFKFFFLLSCGCFSNVSSENHLLLFCPFRRSSSKQLAPPPLRFSSKLSVLSPLMSLLVSLLLFPLLVLCPASSTTHLSLRSSLKLFQSLKFSHLFSPTIPFFPLFF